MFVAKPTSADSDFSLSTEISDIGHEVRRAIVGGSSGKGTKQAMSRLSKETQRALVDHILTHHNSLKLKRARIEILVSQGRFDDFDFQYFKKPEDAERWGSRSAAILGGVALGALLATLVFGTLYLYR